MERPRALRYRFAGTKGAIPREALEEHVEINRAYVELIDGGYTPYGRRTAAPT